MDIEDAEHFEGGGALRDIENPENALLGEELRAVVDRAIADLPEDLRAAVTLREFDGLSYDVITSYSIHYTKLYEASIVMVCVFEYPE